MMNKVVYMFRRKTTRRRRLSTKHRHTHTHTHTHEPLSRSIKTVSRSSRRSAACEVAAPSVRWSVERRFTTLTGGTFTKPVAAATSQHHTINTRGATTFSKLGVQFLGLGYCTEQNTDGIPSFVDCSLLRNGNHTLHQKVRGSPSIFFFWGGGSDPPLPPAPLVVAPLINTTSLITMSPWQQRSVYPLK